MKEMLDDIRKCVENESLSFIVGAGFSKNISTKFPLWSELLEPLVRELYPNCCSKEKISEMTYLGIASEYVRRKGYHEAIDLHIDKTMPYLRRDGENKYELLVNGKVVDTNPSTECHEKLLALGAKHIFTFNYDNTLDILADVDATSKLLTQEFDATEKATRYKKLLEEYAREYNRFSKTKESAVIPDSEDSEFKSTVVDFSGIDKIVEKFQLGLQPYSSCISDRQNLYNEHLSVINVELSRLKHESHRAKVQRTSQYHLITDAYQISLTDGCKNIYKLHGNHRIDFENPDCLYDFDGDKHIKYVITQEDYDSYPCKHEAFVNLMRISLLKGNFCLIGFSGDDANFLGWINWVKDILDDSASCNVNVNRSIYYINVDSKKVEPSKALLLKNHYIKVLDLFELFQKAKSEKERILMFLDYIGRDAKKYSKYDEDWVSLDMHGGKWQYDISDKSSCVESVYNLSRYNRIPNQFGAAHYYRDNICSRFMSILEKSKDIKLCSKLVYSAIKGELIPIHAVLKTKHITQLSKATPELKDQYNQLKTRGIVLNGNVVDEDTSDWAKYESALSLLFNLCFGKVKILMDLWTPRDGIDCMRKFMLQSVYEKDLDTDAITKLINPENFSCIQDYKFAIDLLPHVRGIYVKSQSGSMSVYADLQLQIDSLSKSYPHLIKFQDQIDGLVDQIMKSKSKPFGNTKEEFTFSSSDPLQSSIKVLQILLELGMPTVARNIIFMDSEKWRRVCERLFEYYPQPCLYFTLLYGNNKDLVRRISQQYIYSANLKNVLPKMLTQMLDALLDPSCPMSVQEAIYIAAPIFMKAVSPSIWTKSFEKFYKSLDLEKMEEGRMNVNNIQQFIVTGVDLTDDVDFKHAVILSNLQLTDEIRDVNNRILIAASKDIELTQEECDALFKLLECAYSPVHMYVLMNMSKWIGRKRVAEKLESLDDKIYDDYTLLGAACQYANDNISLQCKLKNIILNSDLLWQTGISEECSSVSLIDYTLDMTEIQQEIHFEVDEIESIYDRLKKEFAKIDKITQKWSERKSWGFMTDWSYVLVEMQDFLRNNKSVLKVKADYSSVLRAITTLLNQGRGGNTISSLLLDDGKTSKAISWLTHDVFNGGPYKFKHEYMLLVNKILSKKSVCLNSCFIHFGWALTKYSDDFDKVLFKPLIEDMLNLYKPYFTGASELSWDVEDAEKIVVERELRKVYNVYKSWGGYIHFWDKYIPRYYDKNTLS